MIGAKDAVRSYKLGESAILKLEALAQKTGMKDFDRKKSLYSATYKKDIDFLKREFEARKKYGFKVTYLGESAVQKEFGFKSHGGILSEIAATIDSYLFTHSLLQFNLRKGLKVYDRTPASTINHNKHNVQIKTRDKFVITAKKLVYATGYEVVNFISKPVVKLVSTYAIISES